MHTNRRNWLKQISLAYAGVSIAPMNRFVMPDSPFLTQEENATIRLSSNENPYGPSPWPARQ